MTRVYHSTLEPERMLEDSKYIAGAAAPKFFLRVVKSRQNSIKSSMSSANVIDAKIRNGTGIKQKFQIWVNATLDVSTDNKPVCMFFSFFIL